MLTITECHTLCAVDFATTKATHAFITIQGLISPHSACYTLNDGDDHCIKWWAVPRKCFFFLWFTAQSKINIITSYRMNPLKSFGLNGHREFQTGDIYVRQSKAEQWLRLISILMNANWHICYGGLAVQTLQLAWLINYPPAGGSLEMEAGEWSGGVWMGGIKEERWKNMRKKTSRKLS